MKPDQTFWVGQKAFIKKGGDVLVLNDPDEGLDFPGGKIQKDEEDLTESLRREVREETGLDIKVGVPFAVWHNRFPESSDHAGRKVYLVAFRCEYVSGSVVLSNEHDEFRWVNKDNYRGVEDGTQYFEILEKYFRQE